jgi:hypothetical protein
MGRSREEAPREQQGYSPAEEAAAAAIAGLFLGAATVSIAAVAAILVPLAPTSVSSDAVVDAAENVAKMVLRDPPDVSGSGRGPAEDRAIVENLLHRGFYGVAAFRRLLSGKPLEDEGRFFDMHQQANDTRLKGARVNDAAADRWGSLLGWHHHGTARTHRPGHVDADRKNYDLTRLPPISTGGWPGTLPGCDCSPAAPYPGAPLLN